MIVRLLFVLLFLPSLAHSQVRLFGGSTPKGVLSLSRSDWFFDTFDPIGSFARWDAVAGDRSISSTTVKAGLYSGRLNFFYDGADVNFSSGGFFEKDFNSGNGFPGGLSEFYIRGFVYHHVNPGGMTTGDAGRKLNYLKSDATFGTTGWAVVVTSFADGAGLRIAFVTEIAPAVQVGGWPGQVYQSAANMQFDTWHCVELYVRANTPGLANGNFKLWLDDVLVKQGFDVIDMRGTSTDGIQIFEIGRQASRLAGGPPVIDEARYWDSVVISRSGPIGCTP